MTIIQEAILLGVDVAVVSMTYLLMLLVLLYIGILVVVISLLEVIETLLERTMAVFFLLGVVVSAILPV